MKKGLAISGGGSRGAFAFGFIQRLYQKGFIADAVSGCSSGALNAVIWATKDFETGERMSRGTSHWPLLLATWYFSYLKGLGLHGHYGHV
jgi:predicted acylesterase/phospholipase RssA